MKLNQFVLALIVVMSFVTAACQEEETSGGRPWKEEVPKMQVSHDASIIGDPDQEKVGIRMSCHQLQDGGTVCDGYTPDNSNAYCYWREACRGASLKPDHIKKGEGCIGYLVCHGDGYKELGLEVGEKPGIKSECE